MTKLAEIEDAELQLAKLKAHASLMRTQIANLTAIQEMTDETIKLLNLQVINARIEYERSK